MTKEDVNSAYSLENLTVSDLAREFGVSTRTIHRYLSSDYKENLPNLVSSNVVVLMDATYWGRRFGVVIMKDHISGRVLWYKFIDKKETIADYREGISYFELHGYNVLGIVSDGLKGLRQEFHQLMTIRTKLTLHPKLQASQDLLGLAKMLCHTDKDSFIGALTVWHEKWKDFINERAKGVDEKTHYVHKNTRSVYLSLKRNMPWLWTFYDFPEL